MPLTVGTAGHIDHGKTWLVRALTGKETDRLPEERERGISIDLGYAPLRLADGRVLSLIDVPGHERFVRNMVAGATGVDLFLLVIDALEGARPQTHEHLAILRLLGVERGVAAVTKADAADEDTLELAVSEAGELVPGAEVVAVSAKTGRGLENLRAALARAADFVADSHKVESPTRLHVDRSFTLRGIGTVVTGTLWSGSVGAGDALRVEPGGFDVRVRSVEVHDRPVDRAGPGQRVAVSLPGVERTALHRGAALVEAGAYPVTYRVDVVLTELERVRDGERVTAHHGTAAVPARVARVGERHAQLRLEQPIVAGRGDRVVLRRADTTVGGGLVVDPAPPRRRDPDRTAALEAGDASALVHEPVRERELRRRGLAPDGLERSGDWVFARAWLDAFRDDVLARLAAADPLDPGVPAPAAPWADAVVPLLGLAVRAGKLYHPGAMPDASEHAGEAAELESELALAGYEPVRVADARLAAYLERQGRLVRVGDGLAIGREAYEAAHRTLVGELEREGSITLARFRDLLGISRRPAQLLLERFDTDGVTRRVGDARVLRRRAIASG